MQIDQVGVVGGVDAVGPVFKIGVLGQGRALWVVAAYLEQIHLVVVAQFGEVSQVGVQIVLRLAIQYHGPLISLLGMVVGQGTVRYPMMRFDEQTFAAGWIGQAAVRPDGIVHVGLGLEGAEWSLAGIHRQAGDARGRCEYRLGPGCAAVGKGGKYGGTVGIGVLRTDHQRQRWHLARIGR